MSMLQEEVNACFGLYSEKLKPRMPAPGPLILSFRQREPSVAEQCDSALPGKHPLPVVKAHGGVCAADLAGGKGVPAPGTQGVWSSGQCDTHQKGGSKKYILCTVWCLL